MQSQGDAVDLTDIETVAFSQFRRAFRTMQINNGFFATRAATLDDMDMRQPVVGTVDHRSVRLLPADGYH